MQFELTGVRIALQPLAARANDPEPVQAAVRDARNEACPVAGGVVFKQFVGRLRHDIGFSVEDHIDLLCTWCPDTKRRATADERRPHGCVWRNMGLRGPHRSN